MRCNAAEVGVCSIYAPGSVGGVCVCSCTPMIPKKKKRKKNIKPMPTIDGGPIVESRVIPGFRSIPKSETDIALRRGIEENLSGKRGRAQPNPRNDDDDDDDVILERRYEKIFHRIIRCMTQCYQKLEAMQYDRERVSSG